MDASSLFKKEEPKVVEEKKWPEMFYKEHEPENRIKMLNTVLESDFATNEDKIRKQILDYRYVPGGKGVNVQYVDWFLRAFLDCIYYGSRKAGFTSLKVIQKSINKDLEKIGYLEALKQDEEYQELYKKELEAMAEFYISLCENDKQYNSFLLGFGKISKEKREIKVAKDFYGGLYVLSERNDSFETMYMWNKAILTAFQKRYDNWDILMKAVETEQTKK